MRARSDPSTSDPAGPRARRGHADHARDGAVGSGGRRVGWLLPLVVGLLAGRAFAADAEHDVPRRSLATLEPVRLVAVVDGDTLDVIRAGRRVRVRLASVDTEERLRPTERPARGAPQTVFGEETALWLAERLEEVRRLGLLLPGGREERDVHGRLLAHLVLPDGRDLNLLLVRLGRSPYFQRYGPSRVDPEAFERAQDSARRERLGIWDPRTNRPATAGAPAARRDYPLLLAWWEARAAAVRRFRRTREADRLAVVAAEAPDELDRAARQARPAQLFGEVEGTTELASGALIVYLRAAPGDRGVRLVVPAARRAALADLGLSGRSSPGVQNFLWIEGVVRAREDHWSILVDAATSVELAGPEPRDPRSTR